MYRYTRTAAFALSTFLCVGSHAETVCSKQMLRNSYGFSGTAAGFTGLDGGNPISCGVGGVMVFDVFNLADRVTIKNLREECASTGKVKALTLTNVPTTSAADKYDLDLSTCTAIIEFNSVGGALASLQVTFTDNGQKLNFTILRTDNVAYGVTGSGTGARL